MYSSLHVHCCHRRPLFVSETQLKATGTFRSDRLALLVLYGENFVLLSANALEPAAAATSAGEDAERVPVLKLLNYAEVRVAAAAAAAVV